MRRSARILAAPAVLLGGLAAWIALSGRSERNAPLELAAQSLRPDVPAEVSDDGEPETPSRVPAHPEVQPDERSPEISTSVPDEIEGTTVPPLRAALRGRVVEPGGAGIAGATVQLDGMHEELLHGKLPTGPAGEFHFEALAAGVHALDVSYERRRARRTVTLRPDEVCDEIVIELPRNGRIEGAVLGIHGEPKPGAGVLGLEMEGLGSGSAKYDTKCGEDGRFALEDVVPGRYLVASHEDSFDDPPGQDVFAGILTVEAEVHSDQTTRVELRRAVSTPVEVFGTVTTGGEPFGGAILFVLRDRHRFGEGTHTVMTDEQGGYGVVLEDAGDWVFAIGEEMGRKRLHPSVVRVPRLDRFRRDFALAPLELSGVVRDPRRKAVSGCAVVAVPDCGLGSFEFPGESEPVETRDDGWFHTAVSEEGEYTLYVLPGSSSPELAAARARASVRADQPSDPVVIELRRGTQVEGRTIGADGAPVSGAWVRAWTLSGEPIAPRSSTRSDVRGHFVLANLPAEELWIHACTADRASSRPLRFSPATAGARGTGELPTVELHSAAWLVVEVEQPAAETPLASRLVVADADGLDHAAIEAPGEEERFLTEGWEFSRHHVGPLPAGRYAVRARLADGRTQERSLLTDGHEETRLVIEFD